MNVNYVSLVMLFHYILFLTLCMLCNIVMLVLVIPFYEAIEGRRA